MPVESGDQPIEERISGVRAQGDWTTVVEHGERITKALREVGASGEALEEWDEWRPKAHENFSDMKAKTVELAVVEKGPGERAGRSPEEDFQTAGKELSKSLEEFGEGDLDDAINESQDSLEYAARAADSIGRQAMRAAERTIIQSMMTSIVPCYFDNQLVSANIERMRADAYALEVRIDDEDLQDKVVDLLSKRD